MEAISTLSTQIDKALEPRRERIAQLSGSHSLLRKLQVPQLHAHIHTQSHTYTSTHNHNHTQPQPHTQSQFLFELPSRLRQCVELKSYEQAVNYYAKASRVLHQYKDMDSFKGIYSECVFIIDHLRDTLVEKIKNESSPQRVILENIHLLTKLEEDHQPLCTLLLERAKTQWEQDHKEQHAQYGTCECVCECECV
jgi:hypothetical protein